MKLLYNILHISITSSTKHSLVSATTIMICFVEQKSLFSILRYENYEKNMLETKYCNTETSLGYENRCIFWRKNDENSTKK